MPAWHGEVSDGGDIALLAPAKDEGAPAAVHNMAIDLLPECKKVIPGRKQRQSHHEPDRGICNPVHRENVRSNRPLLPAMVNNHSDHGNDLNKHLELAEV